MFKLTYQAYMLFGMTMGYGIFRMLVAARKKVFKVVSVIGLVLLCWTFGYFETVCMRGLERYGSLLNIKD